MATFKETTPEPTPPPRTFTLELSEREAKALYVLTGYTCDYTKGAVMEGVYNALHDNFNYNGLDTFYLTKDGLREH